MVPTLDVDRDGMSAPHSNLDDHWVSVPRNILEKFDRHIPGKGTETLLAMYIRAPEAVKVLADAAA